MKYEPYCPAMCHFGINKQSKNLLLLLQNLPNELHVPVYTGKLVDPFVEV